MTTSIYKPYTYLIGWSIIEKYYYGVEYAQKGKIANPANLWTTYFTSSKIIKQMRMEFGEPDIVKVRKVFDDARSSVLWEDKVLRRLDVLNNEKWLNCNITGKMGKRGLPRSEETKRKISEAHKGKIKTAEHCANLSKSKNGKPNYKLRGRKRSDEHREKIRRANTGKIMPESQKRAISLALAKTNLLPEVTEKRSKAMKGRKQSKEEREMRSLALRGKSKSETHKLALSKPKNRLCCIDCQRELSVNSLGRHKCLYFPFINESNS